MASSSKKVSSSRKAPNNKFKQWIVTHKKLNIGLVTVLVLVLGFGGYAMWQNHSANASGWYTVRTYSASNGILYVYNTRSWLVDSKYMTYSSSGSYRYCIYGAADRLAITGTAYFMSGNSVLSSIYFRNYGSTSNIKYSLTTKCTGTIRGSSMPHQITVKAASNSHPIGIVRVMVQRYTSGTVY